MPSETSNNDPFALSRFVEAQQSSYSTALSELQHGKKRSHWMWFIFPQIDGLGSSPTAKHYAIKSKTEAQSYLDHPILGKRLVESAEAILRVKGRSASEIFGYPDDFKLKSSMTLFASLPNANPAFAQVLDMYFQGQRDSKTLELLAAQTN